MGENGFIKIGLKGKKKLRFEDATGNLVLEMLIDVVATHNAYTVQYREFQDESGETPKNKLPEINQMVWQFVRNLIVGSADQNNAEDVERATKLALDISLADALDFIARLTEEAIALQRFFSVNMPREQPSRVSLETVTYST